MQKLLTPHRLDTEYEHMTWAQRVSQCLVGDVQRCDLYLNTWNYCSVPDISISLPLLEALH